jgi:hypothetical protein
MSLESLPKDLLIELSLELPISDIFKLCQSSNKFNSLICNSNIFWQKRILKDFNELVNLNEAKRIYKEIVENKRVCQRLVRTMNRLESQDNVLRSVGTRYCIFLTENNFDNQEIFARQYIFIKIYSFSDPLARDFFPVTYSNSFIKNKLLNSPYENILTYKMPPTKDEMELFKKFLLEIVNNNNYKSKFNKALASRFYHDKIPHNTNWENLCQYNIFVS